jgi:hypothetical protein
LASIAHCKNKNKKKEYNEKRYTILPADSLILNITAYLYNQTRILGEPRELKVIKL